MIIGTWNYDIAYDTFAVAVTSNIIDPNYPMFFTRLKIEKNKAVLFGASKRLKATWDINENSQITFLLRSGMLLKYAITFLTPNSLELKELGNQGSTSGYKRQ
jgi:hypothetical protein